MNGVWSALFLADTSHVGVDVSAALMALDASANVAESTAVTGFQTRPLLGHSTWVLLGTLARLIPFLVLAPSTYAAAIPRRFRVGLALCLAVLVGPFASNSTPVGPVDGLHLAIALGGELAFGLLLGTVALMSVVSLQVTGQVTSQLIGFDFATAQSLDQEQTPLLNHLLTWTALVLILTAGGHRLMLGACMDSFESYPIGSLANTAYWLSELQIVLGHTFSFGLRVGAPIGLALVLANIVTGLISRALPQASLLAIGFNLNTIVLMMVLFLSIGGIGWTFQTELGTWLDDLRRLIHDS